MFAAWKGRRDRENGLFISPSLKPSLFDTPMVILSGKVIQFVLDVVLSKLKHLVLLICGRFMVNRTSKLHRYLVLMS